MEATPKQQIYEVTAQVDNSVVNEFEKWIIEHVNEIVSLEDGNIFSKGIVNKLNNSVLNDPSCICSTTTSFVIQYFAVNEKSISIYMEKHAKNLRKGGADTFGDKLKLSRRVLIEQKSISNPPQTKNFGYVF